jgi:hypothetical protein
MWEGEGYKTWRGKRHEMRRRFVWKRKYWETNRDMGILMTLDTCVLLQYKTTTKVVIIQHF